jgi:hypothetical protein
MNAPTCRDPKSALPQPASPSVEIMVVIVILGLLATLVCHQRPSAPVTMRGMTKAQDRRAHDPPTP